MRSLRSRIAFIALLASPCWVRAQDTAPAEAPSAEPPAAAEEPPPEDEAVVLEPVEVHLRAPSLRSGAARAPGAAVTTVEAKQFAGEAKSTANLVATSPGVAVSEHGGPGQLSQATIRGSSAQQVKVLVDGLPLNGAAGGGVDLSTIPHQWISRIEVIRGTEGVHHGSGALGGVVNVITAPATAGTWGASATAGSFETLEGDVHFGAGNDRWGLLSAVSGSSTSGRFPYRNTYQDRDEQRNHAAAWQGGALVKGFLLGGGGRLDGALQASAGRRELPGRIGMATPGDWQEDARGLAAASFHRPIGEGPIGSAAAWVRADRTVVRLEELEGGDPSTQRGLAAATTLGLSWPGERGSLSASVEVGGERLQADGMDDHTRPTLAAVLAGEAVVLGSRLRIGPGVRVERAGGFSGVSAKLGATLQVGGPMSLRASAGRSFRAPSFAELYLEQGVVESNADLRPEIGMGGDAALVASGWLGSASVGGFATLYDDLIVYEAASFRRFIPQNNARSVARGLELEGALAPLRRVAGLSGGVAYTLLDTETLRGFEAVLGKELPQKPRHRLYARLGCGGEPAEVHAEWQWISRRWVDQANTTRIPTASTIGAGASVRVLRRPAVRVHLEVRNLLDDRTLEDGFMNPLPGRSFLVTLRTGSAEERP